MPMLIRYWARRAWRATVVFTIVGVVSASGWVVGVLIDRTVL